MRPNQQKNRSRGRNGGRKHINPLSRNFESNGPDVKVRGNAVHIAEKYLQLARDAQSSGDSVMAENYLQHAEHYFRIVAAAQPQGQPRPDGTVQEEFDDDDDFPPMNDRFSSFTPPVQQQQVAPDAPQSEGGEPSAPISSTAPEEGVVAQGDGEGGQGGEPRRFRDRRPRRRGRGNGEGGQGNGGNGNTSNDPAAAPQPEVGDLPAFITAGGTTTLAD